MATQLSTRLDPAIFRLPVERIRHGYYSDQYFVYTKELLEAEDHHPHVVMQVFQKRDSVLGGIDEAIAVLKLCSGHEQDGEWIPGWNELEVHALREGDQIAPRETVMTIEGDYSLFAHLETVYLGSLARRSLIMRNVLQVVEAARGKQIFYFPARHDHWLVQTGDGWSAHVAGAIGVSTDAQASWWGGTGNRHGPARADRRLWGRHGQGRDGVRQPLSGRDEHHRAGGLGERLGAGRRSRSRKRSGQAVGRAPGHQPRTSSTARCSRRWAASSPPG